MKAPTERRGFSLVEVIIALLILSVGILALAASTGHVMAQIQAAELRTERMAAVRQTAETLRGTAWSSLETTCLNENTEFDSQNYRVECRVSSASGQSDLKEIRILTEGPGFRAGKFTTEVADTFAISIAKPVQ